MLLNKEYRAILKGSGVKHSTMKRQQDAGIILFYAGLASLTLLVVVIISCI